MKPQPRTKRHQAAAAGAFVAISETATAIRRTIGDEALERAWLAHTDETPISDDLTDLARAFFVGGWIAAMQTVVSTLSTIKASTDHFLDVAP